MICCMKGLRFLVQPLNVSFLVVDHLLRYKDHLDPMLDYSLLPPIHNQ